MFLGIYIAVIIVILDYSLENPGFLDAAAGITMEDQQRSRGLPLLVVALHAFATSAAAG